MPATAVGDGDEPGGVVDGDGAAAGVPVAAVDGVGDAEWDEGGEEGVEADGGVVPGGGALWASVADGLAELEEELGLA